MSDDLEPRFARLWTEQLRIAEPHRHSDFFDDGGTSIGAVHLAAVVQDTFGVSIDAVEIVLTRSFGGILALLVERLGDGAPPVETDAR
jgi:acyl carrier protein